MTQFSSMSDRERIYANGIDGDSGDYALQPLQLGQLVDFIQKLPTNRDESHVIEVLLQRHRRDGTYAFELPPDVDAQDLAQAGWGAIFPSTIDPSLVKILQPLLDWRRQQAGEWFKIFERGYAQGESAIDFLRRNGAEPGSLDPRRMPYYLLLVGSPEQIPFTFQSQLGRLGYAVGRLAFNDPFEYAQYANSLMRMESGDYLMPRTAAFFDAALENDPGINLSSQKMITPLMSEFEERYADQDWKIQSARRDRATKSNLAELLGGGRTPAFLFVNAEGMQFPVWNTMQKDQQGALLCYDWPGPGSGVIPVSDQYFAAPDIRDDARLFGLVAFFYSSFSLGTPPQDEILRLAVGDSGAPSPFVAALPQRMLSHPAGSALAVVGINGRAWGYSFDRERLAEQTATFCRDLQRLAAGERLGSALRETSTRAAQYSTELEEKLQDFKLKPGDPFELVSLWAACQDALGLSLLGDPAVKLRLAEPRAAAEATPGTLSVEAPVLEFKTVEGVKAEETEVAGEVSGGRKPVEEVKEAKEEETARPEVRLGEEERQRIQRILGIVQPLSNDRPAEKDLLGIADEVHALADALILRQIRPPIAVGILGGWGSGKSSVMNLIHKRIAERRAEGVARGWHQDPSSEPLSVFVGHIYQITFNAWTYAKSNLWASLIQTVFFELNRQMSREHDLADQRVRKDHPELFVPPETGKVKADKKETVEMLLRDALKMGGIDYSDIYKPHAASRLNPLWEGLRQRKQQEVEDLQITEGDIARMKAQHDDLLLKRQQEALQRLERQARLQAITLLVETTQAVVKDSGASTDVKSALTELEGEKERLKKQEEERSKASREPVVAEQAAAENATPEDRAATGEGGLSRASPQDGEAAQDGEETEASLEAQMLELISALRGFGMTLVRLRYLFRNTGGWGKAVILALAALGLLAIFLPLVLPNTPLFKDTLTRLAALAPMVLPWARMAASWSKQVNQMLGDYETKVEAERQNLISRLSEELSRRQSLDAQDMQIALLKAGANVSRQEETLDTLAQGGNLAALEEKLRRAELKAEEQRRLAGPAGQYVSLLEFVRSRLDEAVYEKELGLMHRIKRDIDELTDGLTVREMDISRIQKAKRKLFPRGEARILLYIDDLDRCPPPRVVEVLEAVQLLVSTELFIVVLGLDTRYITRALEKEYKEILQHSGDPSGLDYIEKIIQLPYRVRPINPEQLDDFIDELMKSETAPPSSTGTPVVIQTSPMSEGQTPPAERPPQVPERAAESDGGAKEAGKPEIPVELQGETEGEAEPHKGAEEKSDQMPGEKPVEEGATPAGPGVPPPSQPDGTPSGGAAPADGSPPTEGPRPLPLAMILLTDVDKGELERCLKQISLTPRGVKRLVNVLKLLKVFWVNTQGGDPLPEIKRTVIGMLSLSAAYPEAMVEAFAQLDTRYRTKEDLSEYVGDFLTKMERSFLSDRWHQAVNWQLDNFHKDVNALMTLDDKVAFFKISLETFEKSFNLVRSFSFVGDPVYAFDDQPPEGGSGNPSPVPAVPKGPDGTNLSASVVPQTTKASEI